MALVGKRYQRTDGLEDIFTDATSGGRIIIDDEFPNLRDVP
jgi:hypothetical protein